MKTIYQATKNSDQVEGRGHQVPIGAFFKKADAERAAVGWGGMGGGSGEVDIIHVYESFEEFDKGNKENLRKKARAKLTTEEYNALVEGQ